MIHVDLQMSPVSLEPGATTGNRPADGAERPENCADYHQDHADNPQQVHIEDEAEDQ